MSLDPRYLGVSGTPVDLVDLDGGTYKIVTTNNRSVRICALLIKSSRRVSLAVWEYVLDAGFGDAGAAVAGSTAKLVDVPALLTIVEGDLSFGALQNSECGRSADTITVQLEAAAGADLLHEWPRAEVEPDDEGSFPVEAQLTRHRRSVQ